MINVNDGLLFLLLRNGMISEERLAKFQEENPVDVGNGHMVNRLLEKGYVNEEQVAQCNAVYLDISYFNLRYLKTYQECSNIIDPAIARMLRIFPLVSTHGDLAVAVEDPFDHDLLACARYFLGNEVRTAVVSKSSMDYALDFYFKGGASVTPDVSVIYADTDPNEENSIGGHTGDQLHLDLFAPMQTSMA